MMNYFFLKKIEGGKKERKIIKWLLVDMSYCEGDFS